MTMSVDARTTIIRTVVGNGEAAWSGDGGAAAAACLNEPKAVALDRDGNLLIADSENHVIRKVDRTSGLITTVAGCASEHKSPSTGMNKAAVPDTDDPLNEGSSSAESSFMQQSDLSGTVRYVVNGVGSTKRFGGDGGPALDALLNFPTAIAVDAEGDVYIADTMNHRIRRVDARTGLITTIAGLGLPRFAGDGGPSVAAGLNEPAALVVHGARLYVADQSNNRIRMVDLRTGMITTVAGTGTATFNGDGRHATEAALAGPSGITVGTDGRLYIADTFNGRIRAVDPATGKIETVVGDGGEYRYQGEMEAPSPSLSRPSGIAVDGDGNVLMSDSDNHLVRRWDRLTGRIDRVAGIGIANYGGDGKTPLEASLNYPFGIVMDQHNHLFVADTFNHRIREIVL